MDIEVRAVEGKASEAAPLFGTPTPPTPVSGSRYEISRTKALELFALRGFGQVSMRDLATHLGLAAGSLYHHFPSKQHLLFDLMEEFYDDLGTILRDCLRSPKAHGKPLQRFIKARLALHQEHPFHGRIVQRDVVSLEGEHRHRIDEMKKQFENDLMRLIGAGETGINARIDASGHIIAELVTGLPYWLENYPISGAERLRVAEMLILGVVQSLQLQKPD